MITITLTLTGCGLFGKPIKQEPITITETVYVHPQVPKQLFKECIPTKPMAVDQYLSLSQQKKEMYLTDYIVQILGVVKDCNSKLAKIESLLNDQKQLRGGVVK